MTDRSRLTPDIDAVDINSDESVNDPLSLSSSLQDTRLNISAHNENESVAILAEGAPSSIDDDSVGNTSRAETVDVKPNLVPIYEVHKANNEGIRKQLEDTQVEIIDDMEITYTSKGFGQPLNATSDGLIKREHRDEISGDFPFMNTVRIFLLKWKFAKRYVILIKYDKSICGSENGSCLQNWQTIHGNPALCIR